jgi:hypothetical protein
MIVFSVYQNQDCEVWDSKKVREGKKYYVITYCAVYYSNM